MAKKVLIAQAVLVGGFVLGLLLRELPGAVRELRMWRMSVPARPRPRSR